MKTATLKLERNKWTTLLVVTVIALAGLFYAIGVRAQPSSLAIQTTATATTTVSYMTAGAATSTYQFDNPAFSAGKVPNMQAIDDVTVLVQFTASSTAAALAMQYQVSNNNIDWYSVNQVVGTPNGPGTFLLASTSATYLWTPGVTATTGMAFKLPNIQAQHARLVFSIPGGGASGAVYAEIDLKKNPSNP